MISEYEWVEDDEDDKKITPHLVEDDLENDLRDSPIGTCTTTRKVR
jgi:hypothetical protein